MAIKVDCPICTKTLSARDEKMGHRVRCPGCRNEFKIVMGHGGVPIGALSKAEAKHREENARKAEAAAGRAAAAIADMPLAKADVIVTSAADRAAAQDLFEAQRSAKQDMARKVGGFDILPGRDLVRWAMNMAALAAGCTLVLWAIWMLGTAGFTGKGVGLWAAYIGIAVAMIFAVNFFAGESPVPVVILIVMTAFPIVYLILFTYRLQRLAVEYSVYPLLVFAGLGVLLGAVGFIQRLAARGRFGPPLPGIIAVVLSVAAPAVRFSRDLKLPFEIIPSNDVLYAAIQYKAAYKEIYQALSNYAAGRSTGQYPPDLLRLAEKDYISSDKLNDPYTGKAPKPNIFGGLKYVPGQDAKSARVMSILVHSDPKLYWDPVKEGRPAPPFEGKTLPGRERIYVLHQGGTTSALTREEFERQLAETTGFAEEGHQAQFKKALDQSEKQLGGGR